MKKDIEDLFEYIKNNYHNLIIKFNLNNFDISNINNVKFEIKHILEDLRSVYEYVAVNINEIYCHRNEDEVYFPYAKENTDKIKFINENLLKNFPNIPQDIMNLIIDIQHFKSHKKWLLNLTKLTNRVKHIELSINKIKVENRTTYTDGETSMIITGNPKMTSYNDGYAVFPLDDTNVYGEGAIYNDGIIGVGKGTFDINNPTKTNLNITYEERNVLQFKLIGENVEEVLTKIIDETQIFLDNFKRLI
jgi:hypothetical protein